MLRVGVGVGVGLRVMVGVGGRSKDKDEACFRGSGRAQSRSRVGTKDELNCLFDLLVFVSEGDVFFDPVCRVMVKDTRKYKRKCKGKCKRKGKSKCEDEGRAQG